MTADDAGGLGATTLLDPAAEPAEIAELIAFLAYAPARIT
jgi:hypothetical protein